MSSSERRRILVGGGLGKISGERRDEFPHHTRSLRQGPGGRRREGTLALGPPRCVPPTASPPPPGQEKQPRAPARPGARAARRAVDRMRARRPGQLWATLLALGALAGVVVGGERGGCANCGGIVGAGAEKLRCGDRSFLR